MIKYIKLDLNNEIQLTKMSRFVKLDFCSYKEGLKAKTFNW